MVKSDGCDSPQIQIENIMINTVIHIFINILFFLPRLRQKSMIFWKIRERKPDRGFSHPAKNAMVFACAATIYIVVIYILLYGHHFGGIS